MPRRYQAQSATSPAFALRLGTALRSALGHGYTRKDLRADLLAGIVVGIVALPLSMALAVASGVAPQYGLYTAILAGGVIAALGGSMVQVAGPTRSRGSPWRRSTAVSTTASRSCRRSRGFPGICRARTADRSSSLSD